MKKVLLLGIAVIILFALVSCVPGVNTMTDTPNEKGRVAGFLLGLWHGFIALFTFIISIFTDKVNVYEVHNSGGWYDFGFIIGIAAFFGGGSKGTCRRRKRRE